MGIRKKRSQLWVITTHILMTCFAMPFVATVVAHYVLMSTGLTGLLAGMVSLALLSAGYLSGVHYSLAYIGKVAFLEHPTTCVLPCVVAFAVFGAFGFAINGMPLVLGTDEAGHAMEGIAALLTTYLAVTLAFAKLTHEGFSKLSNQVQGP